MTFICRPTSVDMSHIHWILIKNKQTNKQTNKQKNGAKRDLMSTLDFRDVLDGNSETCSMKSYFYICNLTWINICRIEETTGIAKYWGICYFYYDLFIGALWDPDLWRCNDFIREFGFLLYWPFHTYNSQFVLMCFCVYRHILPLCCMPHLLIFLKCSLAFVIVLVSTLLVFMLLFSQLCLLSYCSSSTEDQRVFCQRGTLPTPYRRSFNGLFITIFIIYYSFFISCFILNRFFLLGPIQFTP